MTLFTLLPRLFRRNVFRLMLAFFSLMVGALTLAILLGLVGSVQKYFVAESQTLLGGDLTIESSQPIDKNISLLNNLKSQGFIFSHRLETLAMAQAEPKVPRERGVQTPSLLTSVKVVEANYPLYGQLRLQKNQRSLPEANEVFVANDLLQRMGLMTGDQLKIGQASFIIADVVLAEPDQVAGSFRFGPLVVLSEASWATTGIQGDQSRASHYLSLRFPPALSPTQKAAVTEAIKQSFPAPRYEVAVASEGPSTLLRILEASEQFFLIMIVLTLFLVVVNIRLNFIYFLAAFQKTIAIMRSVGMRKSQVLFLFLGFLLMVALLAGLVGTALGNILANQALPFAEGFIGSTLPSIELTDNVEIVTLFTFVLCLFSALGFLNRALSIEPKLLLLGYGTESGGFKLLLRELPMLMLTLLGLFGGVWYLTQSMWAALIAVGLLAISFGLLFLLARGGISLGYTARLGLPLSLRSIFSFLKHQGLVGTTAIASLTIALTSIFAIALIEQNVRGNLSTEFKEEAPNIYLIDIQEDQLAKVRSLMGSSWQEFYIIRARFTFRDGMDIQANLAQEDPELSREFNLTSSARLIEGEKLVAGKWHGETGKAEVSVEKDFAKRAKLELGSRVEFSVQGFPIEATVTSIREVNTTSGLPFFFLVFSPDVLADFPRSYFGYAYIQETEIPTLQNELASQFPNVSSLPTTQIIQTVQRVVSALSATVLATALPALALGFILILAMLILSVRERVNDMLVFTAFGARLRLIFSIFLIEAGMVVVLASLLAGSLAHLAAYALNHYVFDFTGFYFAVEILYLFLGLLLMTLLMAFFFARRFIRLSPKALLAKGK